MIQITRIPSRSFQFKFTDSAINYKQVADDFCKSQKEILMNLTNKYKKILQINNLRLKDKYAPPQPEISKKPDESSSDLSKHKEVSDAILALARKDHETTMRYRDTAKKFYDFVSTNINTNLESLIGKINASIERIQTEASHAYLLFNN